MNDEIALFVSAVNQIMKKSLDCGKSWLFSIILWEGKSKTRLKGGVISLGFGNVEMKRREGGKRSKWQSSSSRLVSRWLLEDGHIRHIIVIHHSEINTYLSTYLLSGKLTPTLMFGDGSNLVIFQTCYCNGQIKIKDEWTKGSSFSGNFLLVY